MIDTTPQTSTEQLPSAAIAALHQGNKIEAIKIVRRERGIGLEEAKDAVDLYVQGDALLQSKFAAAQAGSKRRFLIWTAALVVLALIGYYLFSKGMR